MNARTHGLIALAMVAAGPGCLPAGSAPPGRHVIHDRNLSAVYLSPSEVDGVPSYLFAGGPSRHPQLDSPLSYQTLVDLYAFSDPNAAATIEGLSVAQPVLANVDVPSLRPTRHTLATDALGRLLFVEFNPLAPPSQASQFEVRRFDPASGLGALLAHADPLSSEPAFILSPSRARGFTRDSGSGRVFELEGDHLLWSAWNATFVGEDFYCAGVQTAPDPSLAPSGSNIIRIKANAEPEVLLGSTGQLGLAPVLGDLTPQMLLSLGTDQGFTPFALLDSFNLVSTPLPPQKGQGQFVSASPDGHWLLFVSSMSEADSAQPQESRLFLFDWVKGVYTTLDSAQVGQTIGGHSEWRPGHDELWISTLPDGLLVLVPGSYVLTAPIHRFFVAPSSWRSAFTRDGRHFFSTDGGDPPAIFVGSSDEPAGPVLSLNPAGTRMDSPRETGDGRLLAEAWLVDSRRSDIYLVDPDAMTSRTIASNGHVLSVGQTRALALLNFDLARLTGDLTLVDLASGDHTLIAEDVYAVAVDRGRSAIVPAGSDVLAPRTRVAFLTRNRLDSPYDGLWVTELP